MLLRIAHMPSPRPAALQSLLDMAHARALGREQYDLMFERERLFASHEAKQQEELPPPKALRRMRRRPTEVCFVEDGFADAKKWRKHHT